MKVLVATKESQGEAPGDYAWTVDGELVTPVGGECSSPSTCGCGRGFAGLASSRATTTAMVVELSELTRDQLWDAVSDSLERGGWADHLDDDEFDDLVHEHLSCIEIVCDSFTEGTVVRRWGSKVYDLTPPRAA